MAKTKYRVLNKIVQRMVRNKLGRNKLFCSRCGKEIKFGEKFKHNRMYAKQHPHIYHKECYEEMFLDV